jgi:hypothetical protein
MRVDDSGTSASLVINKSLQITLRLAKMLETQIAPPAFLTVPRRIPLNF